MATSLEANSNLLNSAQKLTLCYILLVEYVFSKYIKPLRKKKKKKKKTKQSLDLTNMRFLVRIKLTYLICKTSLLTIYISYNSKKKKKKKKKLLILEISSIWTYCNKSIVQWPSHLLYFQWEYKHIKDAFTEFSYLFLGCFLRFWAWNHITHNYIWLPS